MVARCRGRRRSRPGSARASSRETYFSTCGVCEWCRDGRTNLCPERRSIGSFVDGGFAPQVVVAGAPPPPHPGLAGRARGGACRAARVRLPLPARPAEGRRPAIGCSSPGRGRSACSRRRWRGRWAATCSSWACRPTAARLEAARAARARDRRPAARTRSRLRRGRSSARAAAGGRRDMPGGGRAAAAATCRSASSAKPVTVPLDHVFQKELVVTSGFASTPRSWRRALALIERAARRARAARVARSFPSSAWERVFADLRAGRAIKVVFDPRL